MNSSFKLTALAGLACAAGAAFPQIDTKSVLVHKDRTFLVGPAVLVCEPRVTQAFWSGDGRYLLYQHEVPASPVAEAGQAQPSTLSIYDAASGRSQDFLKLPAGTALKAASWFGGSSNALVVTETFGEVAPGTKGTYAELFIVSASGQVKQLRPWQGSRPRFWSMDLSPTKPVAIIAIAARKPLVASVQGRRHRSSVQTYGAIVVDDRGNTVQLNLEDELNPGMFVWSQDGSAFYLRVDTTAERRRVFNAYPIDLRTGKLGKPTPVTDDAIPVVRPAGLITARSVPQPTMNSSASAVLRPLWLETRDVETPHNRMLAAGDATLGEASPKDNAVAFISHGALFVRPITPISRKELDEAIALELREEKMRQAKQVGLGLLIYAGDHDDRFPTQAEFIEGVGPYMRSRDFFNGFVYTFKGGLATALKDPRSTELGHIVVPGGRVVVYADSSTRFVPDPKP